MAWEQDQEAERSRLNHKQEAGRGEVEGEERTGQEVGRGYKPTPTLPPAKFYLLKVPNIPKQHHHQATKC